MSKTKTIFIVCLLVILAFTSIIYFSESPVLLFQKIKKQNNIGAIAIRDNVIPFQKFGTRLFSYPYLNACYGKVVYLTEYQKYGQHQEFVTQLNTLLDQYSSVDIYLLAHANTYYSWVAELDSVKRQKIRLVYNTGCSGASQSDIWLNLGAKSYVAHTGKESLSPVFYFYFLRRWCAGYSLQKAIAEANNFLEIKLNRFKLYSFSAISVDSIQLNESQAQCFGQNNYKLSNE